MLREELKEIKCVYSDVSCAECKYVSYTLGGFVKHIKCKTLSKLVTLDNIIANYQG